MQNKVVLVTGGAKRVGAEICRRLHAAGANIAVHYRSSASQAQALQLELNQLRPNSASVFQADLLELEVLPTLVNAILEKFGRLDALVNNASSFYPTSLSQATQHDWDDLMGSNLKAPLFLAQAVAAELRLREGCIVNITDIHAERPLQGHLIYSVAKAGLVALTRGLALELAPYVRVNAVAPGAIIWPETELWADIEARQKILASTILKRVGDPEDIAKAVIFLIQNAPYMTGQILTVDGGRGLSL